MEAKYPNGTRVKVKVGHEMWSVGGGKKPSVCDIAPYLTEDTATVMYTYGEKYGGNPEGRHWKEYGLKFDKYGEIAWFDEENLIPIENATDTNNNTAIHQGS